MKDNTLKILFLRVYADVTSIMTPTKATPGTTD